MKTAKFLPQLPGMYLSRNFKPQYLYVCKCTTRVHLHTHTRGRHSGKPSSTQKILKGSYTTILTLLIGVRCCTLISELISDSAPTRFLLFVIFFIWKFRFKIARFLTRIRFTPKQIQINSGSHFTFHARFSTQHTQFMHIHFQYVLNKIQNIYN